MGATGEAILLLLKTHGRMTAGALADRLAISPQAAHQQLQKLADVRLVAHADQPAGRGRPKRYWRLTEAGDGRFPDSHAELAVVLIEAVRSELGEDALDRLITRQGRDTLGLYRARLAGAQSLEAKVAALAELRTEAGYMADWQATDHGFRLVENHCPISAAAKACERFCRAELEVFRAALGPDCTIARTEHIVAGARRCAYEIRPI